MTYSYYTASVPIWFTSLNQTDPSKIFKYIIYAPPPRLPDITLLQTSTLILNKNYQMHVLYKQIHCYFTIITPSNKSWADPENIAKAICHL